MTDGSEDSEKEFFLSEFNNRTLVIALEPGSAPGSEVLDQTCSTVSELIGNGSRVAVVVGAGGAIAGSSVSRRLDADIVPVPTSGRALSALSMRIVDTSLAVVESARAPIGDASRLATSLGVSKLVLTDPLGGSETSFGNRSDLDRLESRSPAVAEAARWALDGGVRGVNLCRVEELATELFTFDGAGTLFTHDAYVRISRLTIDDCSVVQGLVQRGVAEGFLRPRTRQEISRISLQGYGARVAPNDHLAGIGALETEQYGAHGLAEVACLYTLNRFTGEGIATDLVNHMVGAATQSGLSAVFACTVSDRAAAVFERSGFVRVPDSCLPAEKWTDYDPARRAIVRSLWRDLGSPSTSDRKR